MNTGSRSAIGTPAFLAVYQGRSHWSGWSGFYPTTFLASSYVCIFITSESDRSGVTVRIGESYRLRDIGRRARGGVDTAPSVGTGTPGGVGQAPSARDKINIP